MVALITRPHNSDHPDGPAGQDGAGGAIPCLNPVCSAPARVVNRFVLASTDGPIEHVRTRCHNGHGFTWPTDSDDLFVPRDDVAPAMRVVAVQGTGVGATSLAAFDAALYTAGIANYNLIKLSSILPRRATIVRAGRYGNAASDSIGNRLYLVLSRQQEARQGVEAWAGIGWTLDKATGAGVVVEHHGTSRGEVEDLLHASLQSITAHRPGRYEAVESLVCGVPCQDLPVCALTAMVYQEESW